MVIHMVMDDGEVAHLPFTRSTWESGLSAQAIVTQWSHGENDCHDPAGRLWAELRKAGRICTPRQHEVADREDPTWAGFRKIELVQEPKSPPPREPVSWPPEHELGVWCLCEITTLCTDDARDILSAPKKVVAPSERPKPIDSRGQWSLF